MTTSTYLINHQYNVSGCNIVGIAVALSGACTQAQPLGRQAPIFPRSLAALSTLVFSRMGYIYINYLGRPLTSFLFLLLSHNMNFPI